MIFNNINSKLKIYPQKTCTLTYNYSTTLIGSPATLPDVEPVGSPQISYTVELGHYPTLTGDLPKSIDYVGFLLAGCLNGNGSSARTLNWRVKRNSTSIGNGSQSVAANNKANLNFCSLSGANKPTVGDVLEIYLWCTESALDMQLNRHCLGIVPTKFKPVNDSNKLLANIVYSNAVTTIANFNPYASGIKGLNKYFSGTNTTNFYTNANTGTSSGLLLDGENNTYGILSSAIDSAPLNSVAVDATNYNASNVYRPNSVSWQETNMRYSG
ncbi:MAG TPA: hypothetical protein DEG71_03635 [Clostridiales bacterium]|nr:hypothetical protein [Clostridiales bacterium]